MIDRARIAELRASEQARFAGANPKSEEAARDRAFGWHQGVPFHWMRDWPSPFPLTAAHAHGALVVMDNTWGTALCFNALRHGVDLSIHSLTKYVVGHSDALLGAIHALQRFVEEMVLHRLAGRKGIPLRFYGLYDLCRIGALHAQAECAGFAR